MLPGCSFSAPLTYVTRCARVAVLSKPSCQHLDPKACTGPRRGRLAFQGENASIVKPPPPVTSQLRDFPSTSDLCGVEQDLEILITGNDAISPVTVAST